MVIHTHITKGNNDSGSNNAASTNRGSAKNMCLSKKDTTMLNLTMNKIHNRFDENGLAKAFSVHVAHLAFKVFSPSFAI